MVVPKSLLLTCFMIYSIGAVSPPYFPEKACKDQCKLPPSSNGPGAFGGFYVQYANDECQAFYSCNGDSTKLTLQGGEEDVIDSFKIFPCVNGEVRHRNSKCADQCPMKKVMKAQCVKGQKPPGKVAEQAMEACKAKCRAPPVLKDKGTSGDFYAQTSTNGGCESAFSCNGNSAKVTLSDGMEDDVEAFHIFECKNGAIVHRHSRCADMCPQLKITKIRCAK